MLRKDEQTEGWTDGRSGPTTGPAFAKATQVKSAGNKKERLKSPSMQKKIIIVKQLIKKNKHKAIRSFLKSRPMYNFVGVLLNIFKKISKYLNYNYYYNSGKAEQPAWTRTGQWSKQEACFARATQVWLAVSHSTSVTSGEWIRCSKRIARASGLGRCQSNLCHSWGYERLQKKI